MSDYDVARAKALLDIYGYVDRDGDGWREQPDGKPLVIEMATQSDQVTRQLDELWKKDMDALGLRIALQDGAVAGEPEVGARRQVHDVARRLAGVRPRRAGRARARLRALDRQGQPSRAFELAAFDQTLRAAEAAA